MKFLVPQGIGDSIWCLLKIEDANRKLGGGPLEVWIACFDNTNEVEKRAMTFVSRFGFVNACGMYQMPRFGQGGAALRAGPAADADGYYRYLPDGDSLTPVFGGIDYIMMPNAPLERGVRLENWLPQFEVNWNIMDQFTFLPDELAVADALNKPYAVFFLGSLTANTSAGHNRGPIWTPDEWVRLGDEVRNRFGLEVVVVGAEYDRSYYDTMILPRLSRPWMNMIGDLSIGATTAITKKAKFVISYQSGIGIVASYMGTPVGIFWRQRGDSVTPSDYVTFREEMASAWTSPKMIASGKHLPLVYGRHGVDYILQQVEERKWA